MVSFDRKIFPNRNVWACCEINSVDINNIPIIASKLKEISETNTNVIHLAQLKIPLIPYMEYPYIPIMY